MGSRHTGSSRPINAIAAFTGIGLVSTKFTFISGRYLRLHLRAPRRNRPPGKLRQLRHLGGNLVRRHRDHAAPAERDQRNRDRVVAREHVERSGTSCRIVGHLPDVAARLP